MQLSARPPQELHRAVLAADAHGALGQLQQVAHGCDQARDDSSAIRRRSGGDSARFGIIRHDPPPNRPGAAPPIRRGASGARSAGDALAGGERPVQRFHASAAGCAGRCPPACRPAGAGSQHRTARVAQGAQPAVDELDAHPIVHVCSPLSNASRSPGPFISLARCTCARSLSSCVGRSFT